MVWRCDQGKKQQKSYLIKALANRGLVEIHRLQIGAGVSIHFPIITIKGNPIIDTFTGITSILAANGTATMATTHIHIAIIGILTHTDIILDCLQMLTTRLAS
jgi:hypothetical protein